MKYPDYYRQHTPIERVEMLEDQCTKLEKEVEKDTLLLSKLSYEYEIQSIKAACTILQREIKTEQFQIKRKEEQKVKEVRLEEIRVKKLEKEMLPYVYSLKLMKDEVEHDVPYSQSTLVRLKQFLNKQYTENSKKPIKNNTILLFIKESWEFINKVHCGAFKRHDGDFDYDIHGNIISRINDNTLGFDYDIFGNAIVDFSDIECLGEII